MIKQIWLNLPVKNIKKSKAFLKDIGFRPNPNYQNKNSASFLIGENDVVMMLFPEKTFKSFTQNEIADTRKGTEILLNIDAESKAEVDEMAETVHKVGGTIYAEPGESQGWMYAFGFEDPDGLYIDMDKMPNQ